MSSSFVAVFAMLVMSAWADSAPSPLPRRRFPAARRKVLDRGFTPAHVTQNFSYLAYATLFAAAAHDEIKDAGK